ncbi:ascus development protein [Colletotrichum asianum]
MTSINVRLAPGVIRLYFLCFYFGIGASVWGYNIGILSSILVHPGWREALGDPSRPVIGAIVSVYYIGTLISYALISHPINDWVGRRYAALAGTGFVCLGALLQATSGGSTAGGTMISGRLFSGLGVAIVSTSVPLYQAEISPAKKRGHFVTMNHVGFIAGMAIGLWVGYGMRFWQTGSGHYYGWRLSIMLEIIPAFVFGFGLPWIPETPRWLVEHNQKDRARSTLRRLREGIYSEDQIEDEFAAISKDVDDYHRSGRNWLSLFKEKALFSRLWRATLLQFMSQACGASAMKYYLPFLLESLGIFTHAALMIGAIEMTVKIAFTVLEMFIIDRFGRRNCLVAGCIVMAISMLINGALPLAYQDNKAANIVCIIFIFIYATGFSLGFGPTVWVYNTEIFPTAVRARGLNFASVGSAVASMIVNEIWPIGLAKLHSKVYFIFMAVNIMWIPVLFAFFPETKGRELEDMDALFGSVAKQVSDAEDESAGRLLADEELFRNSEETPPSRARDSDRDLSLIR